MKASQKTLLILFIALAASVVLLFWYKKPKANNLLLPAATPDPKSPDILTGKIVVSGANLPPGIFPLTFGSRGKAVQMIQVIVGVTPDGQWGANTTNAVKSKLDTSEIRVAEFMKYVVAGGKKLEFPLKLGSRGNFVKALQILLNLNVDGIFGPNTQNALLKETKLATINNREYENLVKKIIFGS